jgi:uncharacterized protein (DUF1684 family)
MHDCPHCTESFEDEADFLGHLRDDHPAEFGAVDRRRLEQLSGDAGDAGISGTALLLAGLALAVVGIVVFVTFGLGGSSGDDGVAAARTPTNVGGAHTHGTMEVVVLGDSVDFSRDRYQLRANAFHFEAGEGTVWHVHAEGVTLEWAMSSLGIEVTETSVTFEGTTYRDSDPQYAVSVTVDGEPVDPETYVLQGVPDARNAASQGDHVRIVVEAE